MMVGIVVASQMLGNACCVSAADVTNARKGLYAEYGEKLAALAQWCDERKLPELAKQTREWQPERDPNQLYIFFPAASFTPLWKGAPPSPLHAEWWQKFSDLRQEQAAKLFDLAKQASKEKRTQTAFELVTETAREYPDHAQARIVLGQQKFENGWYSSFAYVRTKGGEVWHEKYGWVPKGQVQKYDQGMRSVKDRWITAEEDAKQHHDISSGWRIDTEHFAVLTNHSLEEGVQLSRRLERLHTVWQQVFYTYHTSDTELAKLLTATTAVRPARRQFQVMCFRGRDEYNQALSPAQPNISVTLGAYFNTTKTVYFFAGDEQDEGTVNHEATHQLFQETRLTAKDAAAKANFWVVEGVACYFESMVEHDGYVTLGGLDEGRFPAAKTRLLENQFYVPLTELTAMGMENLQRDVRIQKMYSQSAGLMQFLMHANGGKYRDALAGYIDAVYAGKAEATTLAKLTQKSYEELDREYREYLQSGK